MQCPRRTSELDEEKLGTANKRQTRQQTSIRQSRLAVPTRTSSDPRCSTTTSSAQRNRGITPQRSRGITPQRSRGITPQRTPLETPGKAVRSLLFTAEKRGGPNDKRWVQEQSQRILERLRDLSIPGLTGDFFTRSNALQHMSIKQFVAIINYCLHQMGGNRLTIGANYVDDIVNVLQKVHYPYQVNKSWLKTPNTQHSFGHVVTLLDFLIDFVPTTTDEELPFCLDEAHKQDSIAGDDMLQAPDLEFQMKMFHDAKVGFKLWDRNLNEEFALLQQQTCSALIQKRCGVRDLAALDIELEELRKEKDSIDKDRASMNTADEMTCDQLTDELKKLKKILAKHHDNLKNAIKQKSVKKAKQQNLKKEIAALDAEIAQDMRKIRGQAYNIEQRYHLIERLGQLKNLLQCQEHEMRKLEDNYHNQQLQLSLANNQLLTLISSFNLRMSELANSEIANVDVEDLHIPLVLHEINLKQLFPKLDALREKTETSIKAHSQQINKIEQETERIAYETCANLEPKYNSLQVELKAANSSLKKINDHFDAERSALNAQMCKLDEDVYQLKATLEELKIANEQKRQEIKRLELDNERQMSEIERQFNEHANQREKYLKEYGMQLEFNMAELEKLEAIVANNHIHVKDLIEEQTND